MAVGRAHHWVNACPGAYGRAASRLHTPFLILTLYDSRFAGQRRVSGSRSRHLERMPVTLSASFGSGSTDAEILRCAQSLPLSEGMTARTPPKSSHGKSYLQTSAHAGLVSACQ